MPAVLRRDLETAKEEYLGYRSRIVHNGRHLSKATLDRDKIILTRFIRVNGNFLSKDLDDIHFGKYFQDAMTTRARSLYNDRAALNMWLKWLKKARWVAYDFDPLADHTFAKPPRREWYYLPLRRFNELIEAGWDIHPQVGMVCALGLYLALRAGEIKPIRIRDVDRQRGKILINSTKTRHGEDRMVISPELDRWLQQWLTWYANHAAKQGLGRLQDHWYLVPGKISHRAIQDPATHRFVEGDYGILVPTKQLQAPWDPVKLALAAIGIPLRDSATGETLREGEHTLRRSAARAFYESLVRRGVADPLGVVQRLLHHRTRAQTEEYIGVNSNRERRDEIMEEAMYDLGDPATNVAEMGERRALRDEARSGV
jgi:integrase